MIKSAQFAKNALLAVVFITVVAFAFSKDVRAATAPLHSCETGESCVIGEFLYDDSYRSIATASCTLTSYDPDGGDPFLDLEAMTPSPEGDGWYSYEFTAPATLGIYRSVVCCTVGSTDYLCLDKSFNVVVASALTQNDVASAVWNATRSSYTVSGSFGEAIQNIVPATSDIVQATWEYSSRSLSTFGNLVSDIWSNSTRSLTSFGTLVANIWNNASRTLTGAGLSSGSLTTKSDLDSQTSELKDEIEKNTTTISQNVTNVQNITNDVTKIKETTKETRLLLEQIVNKPIIETTTEEVLDLGAKLRETEGIANQLFINTYYAESKMGMIILKWNSFEDSEILETTQELTRKLGGENDSPSTNSIFGQISFLKESWDWNLVESITSQVKTIKGVLTSLQNEVESSGRSKTAYSKVKILLGLLDKLESSIGDTSNKPNQKTLFGKLKETKLMADSLDEKTGDIESLLSSWDKYSMPDKQKRLTDLSKKVVTINRIPNINRILLSINSTSEKDLKNKSYFILGIISANKKLLAGKANTPLTSTWLELGSMVFKSLITNPSTLISQTVPLKYYLPQEVKEEDIIEVDAGLTVKYDTEKSQYYVSGEFLLAPLETKTVSVKAQDNYVISQEEIESLRKQAEELSRPLEKTSYFAQGVTLKSDIDVSLDKVLNLMKSNTTPEVKIRAYREAQIEMKAVREKIEKLKELATQAGSVGTLFGFVGGAQTLAVWGLILILTTGFVFLALYMRILTKKEEPARKKISLKENRPKTYKGESTLFDDLRPRPRTSRKLAIFLFAFGLGAGLTFGVALGRANPASKPAARESQKEEVLGSTSNQITAEKETYKDKEQEKEYAIKD